MSCEKYINLIGDLVENKLDERTAERVISHLVVCQNCETEFETLFSGKEIYADFLFEIKPPDNLSAKFVAKLEIEVRKPVAAAEPSFGFYKRVSNSLAFLRLNTALTTVSILILAALGFVLFNFVSDSKIAENAHSSLAMTENPQMISRQIKEAETKEIAPVISPSEPKRAEIAKRKKGAEKEFPGLISVNQPIPEKVKPKREISAKLIELNEEEQNQIAQLQKLEIDTAGQIEKVELLFRSFRNARSIEGTGQYDVAYEKQQARKLLRNNVELKQRVENYGVLSTEEILNKVEPYLLDIANLDSNPPAEQVLKIKDRFRNQNIITDLQGF